MSVNLGGLFVEAVAVVDAGYTIPFGAGFGPAPAAFAQAHGDASSPSSALDGSSITDITIPTRGHLLALAVFTSTADATTVMRVFIDNATNANLTIALTASGPQVFFFPVPESATVGSVVGVQWFAGTSPGRATFSVLVGP